MPRHTAAAPVGAGSGFGDPEEGSGGARERPYRSSAKPVAMPTPNEATTKEEMLDIFFFPAGISPARVLASLSPAVAPRGITVKVT